MADDRRDAGEGTGAEAYEPPAIEELGSATQLTAGDQDVVSIGDTGDDSDRLLKVDVLSLEHALERLRAVRTC